MVDSKQPLSRSNELPEITPPIQLSQQFRSIPGKAYGVHHPVLFGELLIRTPIQNDFSKLDQFIDGLMDKPFSDLREKTDNQPKALLTRILYWHSAMQTQQLVPIFGQHYARKTATTPNGGSHYSIALPHLSVDCSLKALMWLVNSVNLFLKEESPSLNDLNKTKEAFHKLQKYFIKYAAKGANSFHILRAAHELGIPVSRVHGDIFRFGTGCHSRYLQSTLTDQTPGLGIQIAHNKLKTATLLRQLGLPAPIHQQANNPEQAVNIANTLGFPVVIKPTDRERGEGVFPNLTDTEAVQAAFLAARKHSENILVEKHYFGERYRFTVFNGNILNIFYRQPGGITGDGVHTITELVDMEQQRPRYRQLFRRTGKVFLHLDKEALSLLKEGGLNETSIPSDGEFIALRKKHNISNEGKFTSLNHQDVHPDNLQLAIRAAQALKLDLAGIDFITSNIQQSWQKTNAIICEVNTKPQIGDTLNADHYKQLLRALMKHTFGIKMRLLVYTSDKLNPSQTQLLTFTSAAGCNAFSTSEGVWVNSDKWMTSADHSFKAAEVLLACPEAESGLHVFSKEDIFRYGVPLTNYHEIGFIVSSLSSNTHKEIAELHLRLKRHSQNLYFHDHKLNKIALTQSAITKHVQK